MTDQIERTEEQRLDDAAGRLVSQEIKYCVSHLISGLMGIAYDLSRDHCETLGIDPDELQSLAYKQADIDDYRDALDADDLKRFKVERVDGGPLEDGEPFYRWQIIDPDDGEVFDEGTDEAELDCWRSLFDESGKDQPDGSEIFEHWIVSDWLAEKLEAKGESVARDVAGLTVWGRSTTGQMIRMDHVIRTIAAEFFLSRED